MTDADLRVHGATHKIPAEVFADKEKQALSPSPKRPCAARTRQLKRKVANDALVNIDTVRYSVPNRLVGEFVHVQVGDKIVDIFFDGGRVAAYARCQEPHATISCSEHYEGLLRRSAASESLKVDPTNTNALAEMGRSLAQYEAVVQGASL